MTQNASESAPTAVENPGDITLDPVLERFFGALSEGDLKKLRLCFTENGIVNDGGREIRGRDAVARWAEEEFLQTGGGLRPTRVRPISELGGDHVVHAWAEGTYRRGPTTLVVTASEQGIAVLRLRR